MGHNKLQILKNNPVFWTVLLLALLCSSVGGVWAYLLHSDDKVTNTFTVDSDPVISISTNHQVTVSNTAYPVYLRAAVVVNWKNGTDNVLATVPTGYTLTAGDGWVLHDDGFYYYNKAVVNNESTSAVITLTPPADEQTGYTLVADVAVQAIQALGTTDEGDTPAVTDAWGIGVNPTTKELIISTP